MDKMVVLISGEGESHDDRLPRMVVESERDVLRAILDKYPNSCIHVIHDVHLDYDDHGTQYYVYICDDERTHNTIVEFDNNGNMISSTLLLDGEPISFGNFFLSEHAEDDEDEADAEFFLEASLVAEKIPCFPEVLLS